MSPCRLVLTFRTRPLAERPIRPTSTDSVSSVRLSPINIDAEGYVPSGWMGKPAPDDATFEDIEYHLYVRARIEEGRRAVLEGRSVPHDEVKRQLAEWRKRG